MAKDTPQEDQPFNPLDLNALGRNVVRELLSRPVHPLPPEKSFKGSGIYALYYCGDFEPYRPIVEANNVATGIFELPIYIGKAVPKGSRMGDADFDVTDERSIYKRLKEHAGSIGKAQNLQLQDFKCRYLVVAPVWIRLAETVSVALYKPLWNSLIDGFGNHAPGGGREKQVCSKWDTLHPGRSWAARLPSPPYTAKSIELEVREFLRKGRGLGA